MNCTLLDYGKNLCKNDWSSIGTDAFFYKLYYCLDGEAIYQCKDHKAVFTPGNLYIIQENNPYKIKTKPYGFFDVLWFHVDFYLPLTDHLFEIKIKDKSPEYHLLMALQTLINSDKKHINDIIGILSELIIFKGNLIKSYDHSIITAVNLIKDNYKDNISNQEIASILGYNRNYFINKFKTSLGITPHHYLITVKMSHAKRYLLKLKSVSQVSNIIGYSNANVFSRDFKKYFGYSASDYINNPGEYI